MSTVIKGGEAAIRASHKLVAEQRRGDVAVPELSAAQVREQLGLGVDRVISEGSLYDRELAALAIKQSQCDLAEAAFLVRAFRATLRRFGVSAPFDTDKMAVRRRVAPIYKDPPGGQFLGPTYDYVHRFIELGQDPIEECRDDDDAPLDPTAYEAADTSAIERSVGGLLAEDLLEPLPGGDPSGKVADLTREPLSFPAQRDTRLQALARGDEGYLLCLAYSSLRGYGRNHPYIADLRIGEVAVSFVIPEIGLSVTLGEITVTECQTVHQPGNVPDAPPRLTRGYALVLGQNERKAISIALLDRGLRAEELGEEPLLPTQDEELVLANCDNVSSAGLVQHLKLPHYVDFKGQIQVLRRRRAEYERSRAEQEEQAAE